VSETTMTDDLLECCSWVQLSRPFVDCFGVSFTSLGKLFHRLDDRVRKKFALRWAFSYWYFCKAVTSRLIVMKNNVFSCFNLVYSILSIQSLSVNQAFFQLMLSNREQILETFFCRSTHAPSWKPLPFVRCMWSLYVRPTKYLSSPK